MMESHPLRVENDGGIVNKSTVEEGLSSVTFDFLPNASKSAYA